MREKSGKTTKAQVKKGQKSEPIAGPKYTKANELLGCRTLVRIIAICKICLFPPNLGYPQAKAYVGSRQLLSFKPHHQPP